jgi:hypothetical protein
MNTALLGATMRFAAYNFSIAPPKQWTKFTATELNASEPSLATPPNSGIAFKPLVGYRNATTGASMLVAGGTLDAALAKGSFVDQVERYAPVVQKQFSPTPAEPSGFVKGSLRIVQFAMQEKNRVVYRMIFNNNSGGMGLLEFTLPRQEFRKDIEAIEPVIGSLALLKK